VSNALKIGNRYIGAGQPVYVIAEIGLNHNGDIEIAKRLIDVAKLAGCDAVKFQKRTPELCVPDEQKDLKRETPWGVMTYLEYRHRVEFGYEQYAAIDRHCKERGIDWFVSCWDEASVDFIEQFGPVCYKIASASVTDILAARQTKGYAPAADFVDWYVAHGRDPSCRRDASRGPTCPLSCHQRLPMQTRRTEPADDSEIG